MVKSEFRSGDSISNSCSASKGKPINNDQAINFSIRMMASLTVGNGFIWNLDSLGYDTEISYIMEVDSYRVTLMIESQEDVTTIDMETPRIYN